MAHCQAMEETSKSLTSGGVVALAWFPANGLEV